MTEQFFSFKKIPPIESLEEAIDESLYTEAPEDWWLFLTDVVSSTTHIGHGRYRVVNAAAVAFLVAALNASALPDNIPFTFGGDGSTLLAPPSDKTAIQEALGAAREMVRQTFNLEMRIGICPVSQLAKQGFRVRVARLSIAGGSPITCLSGTGIAEAERLLKSGRLQAPETLPGAKADFSGFFCRWLPVDAARGTVVALIISATTKDSSTLPAAYREILDRLRNTLGAWQNAHTVAPAQLASGGIDEARKRELPIRGYGRGAFFKFAIDLAARFSSWFSELVIRLRRALPGNSTTAAERDISMTCDWMKFDGCLKSILDLTPGELDAVRATLEQARAEGLCCYGLHTSHSALLTCFVSHGGRKRDNLHFIDANDGGYAIAAKMLKAQLHDLQS
jgi:hypothetical protein